MFVLSDSQNKKKNVNSQEFEDNPNQHYIYWSQSSMIIADVDNCKKHFSGIACVCSFCTHCIAFLVCTSRIGANRNDRRMYRTCRYASRNDGHPEQLGRHFALGEQDSARSTAAGYRNVINSSSYLVSIGSCGKKTSFGQQSLTSFCMGHSVVTDWWHRLCTTRQQAEKSWENRKHNNSRHHIDSTWTLIGLTFTLIALFTESPMMMWRCRIKK